MRQRIIGYYIGSLTVLFASGMVAANISKAKVAENTRMTTYSSSYAHNSKQGFAGDSPILSSLP